MTYILNKLDELKDDKNQTSLYDLMKTICDGINEGLGGINALEPIIDEEFGKLTIIDANPLPNKEEVINKINELYTKNKTFKTIMSNELASFDLYGYSTKEPTKIDNLPVYNGKGHASFIKDFSFATEITPAFATMISVGAVANGKVVGANNTALSKLNIGLSDRYKNKVLDPAELKKINMEKAVEAGHNVAELDRQMDALKKRYKKILKNYFEFIVDLGDNISGKGESEPKMDVKDVDSYKGTLNNIVQLEDQIRNDEYNRLKILEGTDINKITPFSPHTGFIPFNLSLTMDGLSGMKIYSKFVVDTSYLPSNYPENVEFLIKGISHDIADNKWTTKVESFCISKGTLEETGTSLNEQNIRQQSAYTDGSIVPSSDKVGAQSYSASEVAKSLTAKGQQNGLLNINDPLVLEKLMFLPPSADKTYYPDRYWRLHPSAAKAYLLFYNAAKSAGYNWTLSSAYRSKQHQASLGSGTTVASPGSSPHGLGGAVDISELYQAVGGSGDPLPNSSARQNNPLYKWMSENGPKFGWHNPYRLADGSGTDEIWHWEYWGLI